MPIMEKFCLLYMLYQSFEMCSMDYKGQQEHEHTFLSIYRKPFSGIIGQLAFGLSVTQNTLTFNITIEQ